MNVFEKASAEMLENIRKLDALCKELHRENKTLRTRLDAADSLIAELKRREAGRLSGPTPLGKTERALAEIRELLSKCEAKYTIACCERDDLKSAHAELVQERGQLRVDLAAYKKAQERFSARYDEVVGDILTHYTAVFGMPRPALTHEFYRAAVARLAKYAKASREKASRERDALKSAHAELVQERDQLRRQLELTRRDLEMVQASEAAADSLIAEMKQRDTQDDQARKEAAAAVTAERDQLLVDLENARAKAEVYRKLCTRFSARYDELRDDIIKHYSAAFDVQERFPSHASCRDSIARLAKYAKTGYTLNSAMAEMTERAAQSQPACGTAGDYIDELRQRVGEAFKR